MGFYMQLFGEDSITNKGCKKVKLPQDDFDFEQLVKKHLRSNEVFIASTWHGSFSTVVESEEHLKSLMKNFDDLQLFSAGLSEIYGVNGSRVRQANEELKILIGDGYLKYSSIRPL